MLAWLTLAWNVIKTIFGLGGVDERDKAEQTGERVGAAETQRDDTVASNTALQKANQEATDANVTRQNVDRESDADLDRDLNSVRGPSGGS